MVAVAFVDFKEAFDSVCDTVLETKLEREFGIRGPLLDWLNSYLKGRQQVTILNDHKLSWVPHTLELKKSFVNKLCLLKKLRFLPRKMLQDFYLRIIFPSVNYGLILWGAGCNSNNLDFLERLHCRAARIIFNLPKALASHGVLEREEFLL